MIQRSSNHILDAPFLGTFHEVWLTNGERTIDVSEYTLGVPDSGSQLENEVLGYGRAQQGRVSLTFDREGVAGLLANLPEDASDIKIVIKSFRFGSSEKYPVWAGVAETLPGYASAQTQDTITIDFVSVFSTLGDGDDLIDSDTSEEYKFIHVDELIEAFDVEFATNHSGDIPIKVSGDR